MSQEKGKTPRTYDTSHFTEDTCTQKLIEWMKDINIKNRLGFGDIVFNTRSDVDGRRPDATICERPQSKNVLCTVEFKRTSIDHTTIKIVEKARKEAKARGAKYFATSNFKHLLWFEIDKVNPKGIFELSQLEDMDLIEDTRYRNPICKGLEQFLYRLHEAQTGKLVKPLHSIDFELINILQQKISFLTKLYSPIIRDKVHKDADFKKAFWRWIKDEIGERSDDEEKDFTKAARQASYLLVNKILFYQALQAKIRKLDPLDIPESLRSGGRLQHELQGYFNEVLKIDYETIYDADFIDQIAFPDDLNVVELIKDLIYRLDQYDFDEIGVDVVGRIFEQLIPEKERHNLGQYFTNPEVVDIILKFCQRHEEDKIFDPSCGSGTFLVRAYQHKRLLNDHLSHEEILKRLWGTDIAKFPAHLATINLAINDLSSSENYPQILKEDFFTLKLGGKTEYKEYSRKKEMATLGKEKIQIPYPAIVDCIVGNPPYTRQEEIPEIGVDKSALIESALKDRGEKVLATLSKRAGIHAYFFVHGFKFLQNGGRFGFIVSNSWLDVDYGKGLQEFFLNNAKIVAIIESKVERWFADADINTCIIILEKCTSEKERNDNLVRFVHLKKKLTELIKMPVREMWEMKKARFDEIDTLVKTILGHNDIYENEDMHIYPKKQKELWDEGYDKEEGYIGSKWGKYLRAPQIFFTILKKGKDKLVPLKEVADVRFGIKTGANEFFYLTEEEIKQKGIEKEFWMHKEGSKWVPNYVIKSPRECRSIVVKPDDLKYRMLMIHKDKKDLRGTNILKYIEQGERKKFDKHPTCESRNRWYDLGNQPKADGLWFKAFNDKVIAPINRSEVYSSDRFYAVYLYNKSFKNRLFLYLNSTLASLFVELSGRVVLGEGALDNMTYEAAAMSILDVRKYQPENGRVFKDFLERPIESIFGELDASTPDEVSIDKVKPDRRELDKIIMGDILGLSEEEQLEVYRAVVDLVKSRLDKAKSVSKKGAKGEMNIKEAIEKSKEFLDNTVE